MVRRQQAADLLHQVFGGVQPRVPVDAGIPEHVAARVLAGVRELLRQGVDAHRLHRGDVHEAGTRVERHRLPVVGAERRRDDHAGLAVVIRFGRLDGPAGREVDVACPGDGRVLVRRDELPRLAVEHVEEAVLRRLHQHLARLPVDHEVREDDVLRGRVVPVVRGRDLVVPLEPPGVGIHREDRGQEQVVAAAGRADGARPGRAVAGADIQRVEIRVVGHRVPDRAAAAADPPLAVPGLRCSLEFGILEAVLRVPWHGVEAPRQLARCSIVGGKIAAHAVLAAAVADQHLAFHDARRAGDGVRLGAIDGVHLPAPAAGARVEADESPVERREVDRSLPDGDSTVDRIAAGVAAPLARHLRVVLPELLAGLRVQRIHDAPHARRVHDSVHDDRGGLQPAQRAGGVRPREAELLDVACIDLLERAESLLAVGAAVREPVLRLGVGGRNARAVHLGELLRRFRWRLRERLSSQHEAERRKCDQRAGVSCHGSASRRCRRRVSVHGLSMASAGRFPAAEGTSSARVMSCRSSSNGFSRIRGIRCAGPRRTGAPGPGEPGRTAGRGARANGGGQSEDQRRHPPDGGARPRSDRGGPARRALPRRAVPDQGPDDRLRRGADATRITTLQGLRARGRRGTHATLPPRGTRDLRQDQHPGARFHERHGARALRSDPQSMEPRAHFQRLERRVGRRGRGAHRACCKRE